jgi:glycosyltransferase involved in cell wall biosynthesis
MPNSMRLLSISLDPGVLEPQSTTAVRQKKYYEGMQADILVLRPGPPQTVQLDRHISVIRPGGGTKLGTFWSATKWVWRARRKYQVVTAQEPVFCGTLAWLLKLTGTAFHLQDHICFVEIPIQSLGEWIQKQWGKIVIRQADRIRTVSQRGFRALKRFGIDEGRIDVIPVPIDRDKFVHTLAPKNDFQLVTVARLVPQKGIDLLISAVPALAQKFPSIEVVVIGEGADRRVLEKLAHKLGVADRMKFVGPQKNVSTFFENADVYVQPSRYEGWGMAVIEAALFGLPIVMTDVGCAGEVIREGETGTIVPTENISALTQGIASVFEHRGRAFEMSQRARAEALRLPDLEATAKLVRSSLEKTGASRTQTRYE